MHSRIMSISPEKGNFCRFYNIISNAKERKARSARGDLHVYKEAMLVLNNIKEADS